MDRNYFSFNLWNCVDLNVETEKMTKKRIPVPNKV